MTCMHGQPGDCILCLAEQRGQDAPFERLAQNMLEALNAWRAAKKLAPLGVWAETPDGVCLRAACQQNRYSSEKASASYQETITVLEKTAATARAEAEKWKAEAGKQYEINRELRNGCARLVHELQNLTNKG